jgi:hypothetical protein
MRSELQQVIDLITDAPTQQAARKLLKWHRWRFDNLGPGDRKLLLEEIANSISQMPEEQP